jgi:8-oxo-dGTP pyrophosphatase MutT (NUDIX family)
MPTPPAPRKILERRWNDNINCEFFLSDTIPDLALCHAVYCLAILPKTNQVVLTHISRGWEMLGGHLEPGETIEEAMVRECLEEGGFQPDSYKLFGYNKITATEPVANDHHGGFYSQMSYMPHFIATTTKPLLIPSGEEVIENGVFTLAEVAKLNTPHEDVIRVGLEQYSQRLANKK